MALAPRTTRDASGLPFSVNFDDNGDPDGALTPVSSIVGTVNATIVEPVDAVFTDYPGLTNGELRQSPVSVVDGTTQYTITQTIITATGSAQTALAANANRKAVIFWDAGAANDFRFNFFGAATTTSPIYPPDSGPLILEGPACPKTALSVIGTSTQVLCIWECV